jgi:5-methylcytosine-specific restriction endonuclease McrA
MPHKDTAVTCLCGATEGCVRHDDGGVIHAGPRIPRAYDSRHRYEQLVALYGERCGLCGTGRHLVIDHVIPKGRGGSDRFENLGLLCIPCNTAKRAKSIPDYRVPLDPPGVCTACLELPRGARLRKHG